MKRSPLFLVLVVATLLIANPVSSRTVFAKGKPGTAGNTSRSNPSVSTRQNLNSATQFRQVKPVSTQSSVNLQTLRAPSKLNTATPMRHPSYGQGTTLVNGLSKGTVTQRPTLNIPSTLGNGTLIKPTSSNSPRQPFPRIPTGGLGTLGTIPDGKPGIKPHPIPAHIPGITPAHIPGKPFPGTPGGPICGTPVPPHIPCPPINPCPPSYPCPPSNPCPPQNQCNPWWTSFCFPNRDPYGCRPVCFPNYCGTTVCDTVCDTTVVVPASVAGVTLVAPDTVALTSTQVVPASATMVEVAEQPVTAELPRFHAGSTVAVQAASLGATPGQVVVQIGDVALPAEVKQWNDGNVECTLPRMGLAKPSRAMLHIVLPNGSVAQTVEFEMLPPKS
jgi:hypothetical protein